jgi:hypothetical protein
MRQVILWIGRLLMLSASVVVLVGFAHYSGLKKPESSAGHLQKKIVKLTFYGVSSIGGDLDARGHCQRRFSHPIELHFEQQKATVNGNLFLEKIKWKSNFLSDGSVYFDGYAALIDDSINGKEKNKIGKMLMLRKDGNDRLTFKGLIFSDSSRPKYPRSPHGLGRFDAGLCAGYFSF